MFEIRQLAQPETVPVTGGQFTLTHTTETMHADPRKPDALVLRTMKGFLDKDGNFVDFGDHVVQTLEKQGLADMLADTTGGKPAGVFRTTDILPAIEKREAEIQAEEAAPVEQTRAQEAQAIK